MSCRVIAAAVCIGLAGCATLSPAITDGAAVPQRGPVCDRAVGSATTISATLARSYADDALALQIGELRGDLMSAGLRRVQIAGRSTQCGPYALSGAGSGLVTCTAEARVCAR